MTRGSSFGHPGSDYSPVMLEFAGQAPSRRWRAAFAGAAGNLVEWYDFYVYAAFAPYFAPAFFPEGDPLVHQLESAVVFALGFVVRPVGGYVFGRAADRYGRKGALATSVGMMGLGSLALACCPTYAQVGWIAPALVLAARLLQGFSLGGEYGASATYLTELAPPGRRGLFASVQYTTLVLGQLLAMSTLVALQAVFGADGPAWSWGYRIPFAVGAILALVSYALRSTLEESLPSADGDAAELASRGRLRTLARTPGSVALVVGLTLGGTVAFYSYTIYAQRFLVQSVGLTRREASGIMAAALAYLMVLQPIFGSLSDRIGRRPMLVLFGLLGATSTVPLLEAMARSSTASGALLPLVGLFTILSFYTSVNAVVKAELFPAGVRALGVGLPYALTVSLFGGTAEAVGTIFKRAGHEQMFFVYVSVCAAVTGLVALGMRDTRRGGPMDADGPISSPRAV